MRKFFGLAAVLAAFAFALVFAGCSNSAGGGGNGDETQNGSNQILTVGITPGSAYEEKLTISLSESEKLSAAGAAALTAGKDVSEWFASKAVSASVSDGFVGFKAEIVSATETSLVIKVTGKAGTKKCSVTLSITIPATVTASGKEVKKENVKTVGIGVEPEILQTEHVKVEKVAGGLKFTITRPTDDCYNPNKFFDTGDYDYTYLGQGNGDYEGEGYKYVGDGKGSYKKEQEEYKDYEYVGAGKGDYSSPGYIFVGDGKGDHVKSNEPDPNSAGGGAPTPVSSGNENNNEKYYYNYVGPGKGDYSWGYEYLGEGKGLYKKVTKIRDLYKRVGNGQGDYEYAYEYVGEGQGSYKKGTRGGFGNLQIASSAGMPVAYLNVWSDASAGAYECFYPLVTPGKRYEFLIAIEPYDRNLMDSRYDEKISVVAGEGIGEVDFSQNNPRVDLTYDNASEKPIVIISDLNLPEGLKNPRTGVQYWATNQSELKENGDVDWLLPYAMVWCGQMIYDGLERELSKEPSSEWGDRDFKTVFDGSGKDTLYVNCYVQFDVLGTNGTIWRKPDYCALLKIR